MSRRSRIRKRERKRRQYAQRPKTAHNLINYKTADLIASLARPFSARAFDEALKEVQQAAH
jgi:hypothetical protein